MNKIYYDLHIHSCLSPCGDTDMTPNNIAGMAKIKSLDMIALTDHNTCQNCQPFVAACNKYGIIAICGMELTTSEEIHLVCLFKTLNEAMIFSNEVKTHRLLVKNKADIFGEQSILDENDNIIANDNFLLPIATTLSLEKAYEMVMDFGGGCFPAHIDKTSNSIVAILGTMPQNPIFSTVEIKDRTKEESLQKNYFNGRKYNILTNSDAHYLWDISEKENYILTKSSSKENIVDELFDMLQCYSKII